MSAVAVRCNACHAEFLEEDMGEEDVCPECGSDSLFERPIGQWMRNEGIDSIPWPTAISVRPVAVKS